MTERDDLGQHLVLSLGDSFQCQTHSGPDTPTGRFSQREDLHDVPGRDHGHVVDVQNRFDETGEFLDRDLFGGFHGDRSPDIPSQHVVQADQLAEVAEDRRHIDVLEVQEDVLAIPDADFLLPRRPLCTLRPLFGLRRHLLEAKIEGVLLLRSSSPLLLLTEHHGSQEKDRHHRQTE
ncbi:MAG: hypothetical protein A2Z06_01565 [Candidatus Glassbacteria bacterium RBG_16_58_8]|uniref:Uncharacterized protein n=1 Tax=Candidatus Glassbacteria bacterium RBG_16_58_8 TaxID=1817866 RepID=A0A1F5YDM1_9BACT|nr:MAG: hypothetical protein A2Z06_01565 [Candidatus Glassbacteria bacterium RBG_16_58_8]